MDRFAKYILVIAMGAVSPALAATDPLETVLNGPANDSALGRAVVMLRRGVCREEVCRSLDDMATVIRLENQRDLPNPMSMFHPEQFDLDAYDTQKNTLIEEILQAHGQR